MNPQQRAIDVAEAAAAAWWPHKAAGPDGVPIGVIAALALNGQHRDPSPAKVIRGSTDDEITALLGDIWGMFWCLRPELAIRCEPLAGWTNTDPPAAKTTAAAADVARAVTRAGLFGITQTWDMLEAVDLLGPAYLHLRPDAAKQVNGEYYTPPDICKLLARVNLGDGPDPAPGQAFNDPTAGTGGVFRGYAEVLRERGLDPHDYWWVANDIDPVVVAGLAVNMHLWNLGPHVVAGTANILTDPQWHERAWSEQLAAITRRDQLRRHAEAAAAMHGVHLLELRRRDRPAAGPVPVPDGSERPPRLTLF